MEEKVILFQAVVPIGERGLMMNAWFKIQPKPSLKISGPFHARQPPFLLGISSAFVGSSLYTIGGRVSNHFVLSDCISWLDTSNAFSVWGTSELPSPCVDSVLGVYREFLYILPGVWKFGYYHMDESKYLATRKGYIWNTTKQNITGTIDPPKGLWHRIRACAALDGEGLLIAMDGENTTNFYLHPKPENQARDWKEFGGNPLPRFMGETSFAADKGRLYILELQDKPPAFLYIYDIEKSKLMMDKRPIMEFDDDFWSVDKWDRVVRLVPVADDKLCFLWLGPVSYENETRWPPVRTLHYFKLKVSIGSNTEVEVEDQDNKVFPANITDLLDCLPCEQFEAEAKGESQPLSQDVNELARKSTILFQAVVPSGERRLMMNAWFKIQHTAQIFGPFHGRQPFRLGISSTFVGTSLYTIGGEEHSSRLPKPRDISWLDTGSPFNGWEISELPSPCVDSVICVYGNSLYIFTESEGYIWNTKENKLQTRIRPPMVEGGERRWLKIRACAALDRLGLLIAMDGDKNNPNFYLHPEPENQDRDWKGFGNPLPRFMGKTSFAASNQRLYILEAQGKSSAFLHIYDIKEGEGKVVMDKMPISKFDGDFWSMDEGDRVVRLVPVANDMLCFLWLGPLENKNGWPPVKTLHYLKLKFSFNPNEAFEIVDENEKRFHTNITKLLDCLPCGPEQFPAEVDLLDAFQKQREDNTSTEAIRTSSISGDPFEDQPEDIASLKEKKKGKGRRTLLVYPLLRRQRKISKFALETLKAKGKFLKNESILATQNFQTQSEELSNWKKYEKQCEIAQQMKSTLETQEAEIESLKHESVSATQNFQTPSKELDNWKKYKKQLEIQQQMESTLETLEAKVKSLKHESVLVTQKFQTQSEELENWKKYKKGHTMEESTFRYRVTGQIPLKSCFSGIYYKSTNGDDQELERRCVIMTYKNDDHAISQVKFSHELGDEYALEVLYVDNRIDGSKVKVIYPFFEVTMSKWLKELELNKYQPPPNMSYCEWMKSEVMPKIRKLWKLLHEMKKKNIQSCKERNDQGFNMPLISGVPKLLNLQNGDNVDKNYAKNILENILNSDEACELPRKFRSALIFWKNEIRKENTTLLNYWICSKHPILYDPVDKERFLLLMYDIIFDYGLKCWLNEQKEVFDWNYFQNQIDGSQLYKDVYLQALHYVAGQSRGLVSKKGQLTLSPFDQESPYHSAAGSDIVRFTKNALTQFKENYKRSHNNTTWHRGLDDHDREIVEILDDELDVCALHYTIARTIIAEDPPEKYTEEGWKKYQEEHWKKQKKKWKDWRKGYLNAAEIISQAYQPVQLKLYRKEGWMELEEIKNKANQPPELHTKEGWKKVEVETNQQLEVWTKEGWKEGWMALEETKNKANQPLELLTGVFSWMKATEIEVNKYTTSIFTNEGWKKVEEVEANQQLKVWGKEGSREDWKKYEEIKNESNKQLELQTMKKDWKQATEIIKADQPPSLRMRRNGDPKEFWMEAFEAKRSVELFKQDNWKKAREDLENFFNSLK